MSDVFREVSEDLRREQLKQLWKQYSKFAIAGAVLIVVVVAGYQVVSSIRQQQAAESGDRYQAAVTLYQNGEFQAAEEAFAALAIDGNAEYPILAQLSNAGVLAQMGDSAGAAAIYDAVAADTGADPTLREVAQIRAALLMVDIEPLSEIQLRMEVFNEEGNPYRILALEIMAVSAIRADQFDLAVGWIVEMTRDPFTTDASVRRAQVLFSYITARQEVVAPAPAAAVPADLLPPALGALPGLGLGGAGGLPGFDNAVPFGENVVGDPVIPATPLPGFNFAAPGDEVPAADPPAVDEPAADAPAFNPAAD